MTEPQTDRGLDQILETWMNQAAPRHAPARLLEETFARTMNAGQTRRLWPSFPGYPLARFAAAAVAIAIAVGGAVYLIAPRDGVGGLPNASPSPSPGASPSGSPSPVTYTSTTFAVPFAVTLLDGWKRPTDELGIVGFHHASLDVDAGIMNLAAMTVRGPTPTDPWVPWPDDLYTWLDTRPEFQPVATRDIAVGGRPAVLIDVDTVPDQIDDTGDWLKYGTGRSDGLNLRGPSPEHMRLVIVRSGPKSGIVALVGASDENVDEVFAAFDRLLATLQFR